MCADRATALAGTLDLVWQRSVVLRRVGRAL
jgi:hypothetical protein